MEETLKFDIPKREAEQLQEQIAECLIKIRQSHLSLVREQAEIDELKEETRKNLAEINRLVA